MNRVSRMALRWSKRWRSSKVTRTISIRMAKTWPVLVESYRAIRGKLRCHKNESWQNDLFFFSSAEISVNILSFACAVASRTSRISGFVDPLKGQRRHIGQTLLTITTMQVDAPVVTSVSARWWSIVFQDQVSLPLFIGTPCPDCIRCNATPLGFYTRSLSRLLDCNRNNDADSYRLQADDTSDLHVYY